MSSSSAYQTRRMQNSSEESATSSTSAGSILASEGCRMGFPAPLPPFGTRHFPLDEDSVPIARELRDAATSIVDTRGIDFESVVVVKRRASGATSDKCPTLVITASQAKDNSWYLALKEIQEFLIANNAAPVSVEIVDPTALKLPAHFPIEQDHPIIRVWVQLREDIATILRDTPWSSISAARRGYDNEARNNPVTIIITSSSPVSHLHSTIHYRCWDYGLRGVEIASVHVSSILAAGGFHFPDEGKPISLTNDLYPGAGMGPAEHPTATGTLGGQLTVSVGDEVKCVGLTNFHVVRTADFPEVFETQGYRPADAKISHDAVVSPSDFDTKAYLEELNSDVSSAEGSARDYKSKYGDELEFGERKQATLGKLEKNAEVLGDERQKLENLQRNVGLIWAASGYRARNNFCMDWALISLDHQKLVNRLPTQEELSALSPALPNAVCFPESGEIEEFGELERGSTCLKKGRSTGLTRGTGVNVDPYVRLKGRIMEAWHVVGRYNSPFCDKGDSGSWVVDDSGRLVGLLFSSPCTSYTGDAFVIPIREVVGDIEELTGGKVSLPIT